MELQSRQFQIRIVNLSHRVINKLLNEFNKTHNRFELFEPQEWDFPKTDQEIHCIKKGFEYWRLCAKKI